MSHGARRIVAPLWLALLVSMTLPIMAAAQSTQTRCVETAGGISCNSTTTPSFGDSLLRGYEMGQRMREAAQRETPPQVDHQRQVALDRYLEAQRRREAIDREATGLPPQPEGVIEDQTLERAGQTAYWQQQLDACLRLERSQGRPAEQCIDTLLVTDSYFARANVSVGGMSQTQLYLAKSRAPASRQREQSGAPGIPSSE